MNCSNCLTLTQQLAELEALLAQSDCSCHVINPHKTRIILWKEEKNQTATYCLKIGIQKFISFPLLDKNQVQYWRFKTCWKEPKPETAQLTLTTAELDPVTKFQQRQAQAQAINNHDQANESTVNNPAVS